MSGTIGGRAFHDANNDGLRDDSPSPSIVNGIPNVVVHLHECRDDAELGTDVTNTNGFYLFPKLSEGEYYVRAELPGGYEFGGVWVENNDGGKNNNNDTNAAPRLFRAGLLRGDATNGGRDPTADDVGGSGSSSSREFFDGETKSRDLRAAKPHSNLRRTPESSDGRPVVVVATNNNNNIRQPRSKNRIHHRTLGTGGGPVANTVEKSTIDPRTGRTAGCIALGRGEQTLEWGFGLIDVTDVPSSHPSSSVMPSVVPSVMDSNGPSMMMMMMMSDAPSIAMGGSSGPSYGPSEDVLIFENATNSPSIGQSTSSYPTTTTTPTGNPVANASASPSPVPTIAAVNPTPVTPTTGGVVVVAEDSRAPSSTPLSIDDPTSNIQFSGIKNNDDNAQGATTGSINVNYIIGMACALSFLLLAVALVLHHRRQQHRSKNYHHRNKGGGGDGDYDDDDVFAPPSVVEVKRKPDGDEISDMHMSRLHSTRGVSKDDSSDSDSDLEEEGSMGPRTRSSHGSDGSRESMAALSNIVERSCSGGSRSGDEEAPPPSSPTANSNAFPSSGTLQQSSPRSHSNAYHKSFSDEGARNNDIIHHPENDAKKRPLSQSLPGNNDSTTTTSISPTGSPRREVDRRPQRTMRGLEEEVSSLTDAIGSFPENGKTWRLLNSYLDRAREELEDFRSELNGVSGGGGGGGDARGRLRNDVGGGGNDAAYNKSASNEIIYRKEEQFVCGMKFLDDATDDGDPPGTSLYTGQIDLKSQLPHGLGTLRKDDAEGTMLEGEWEYGTLVKEIKTSDCGVSVVGVKVRADDVRVVTRAPTTTTSASSGFPRNGEIIAPSSGNPALSSSGNRDVDASAAGSTAKIKIIAPSGDLGLVVDKTGEGPTFVRSLDPSSPMKDYIRVDDRIVAINGMELGSTTLAEIGFLLSSKRAKELSIVRQSDASISGANGDDDAAEKELPLPKATTLPSSYRKSVDSDTSGTTLSSTTDPLHISHAVASSGGEPPPEPTLDESREEESVCSDMSGTIVSHTTTQTFISHPDIDKIYKDMVCRFQGFDDGDEESDLLPFFVGDEAMAGSAASDRKRLSTSLLSSTDVSESGANDSTITPAMEEPSVGQF